MFLPFRRIPEYADKPAPGGRETKSLRHKTQAGATDMSDPQAEIARLTALVESLRREVREQRREIAGLREERRALLDADRPQVDERLDEELGVACTPPEWLAKPYWVDPPSGHRYGFPRLYDPASDGDMTEWLIASGYPEKLARQGLPCTFTACTESGET